MADCHTDWLRLVDGEKLSVSYGDRLGRLTNQMTHPATQFPHVMFFLGKKAKNVALRQIFPHNNIGRGRGDGIASLRVDTATLQMPNPILFADSDPTLDHTSAERFHLCHEITNYPLQWCSASAMTAVDAIYSRLFFLFSDVICIFADDLGGLDNVANKLLAWAKLGSASTLPRCIRPRVLIVVSGISPSATYDALEEEDLNFNLQGQARVSFFVTAARKINELTSDFQGHLSNFMTLGIRLRVPYDSLASFIASSLLMDSYPPGMHAFDPKLVFQESWRSNCFQALRSSYASLEFAASQCARIEEHMEAMFPSLEFEHCTSSQLRRGTLQVGSKYWQQLKTNRTCLFCLRRKPEHTMSCGHSICDTCVKIFGQAILARLVPPTARPRVLSIDGGGARGIVPLQFLKLLQQSVKIPIQDFFDVTFGTSSGGLIVLAIFLCQWSVERGIQAFDVLTKKFFGAGRQNQSTLTRFRSLLSCWYSDGYYDATNLEKTLAEIFGTTRRIFDTTAGAVSGVKVAVTATTISDATPYIFSNYNGKEIAGGECGYKHLRPQGVDDEILIWEAARCTTAAPMYMKPKEISALGTFQDGGLSKHNNPVNLALWESRRLFGGEPDLVASLGTGCAQTPPTSAPPKFRNILRDGNGLDRSTKANYFRLNIPLHGSGPDLDNAKCMDELRIAVNRWHSRTSEMNDLISALLVSSFFFELDTVPRYNAGLYRCTGFIRCRSIDTVALCEALRRDSKNLEFITDGGSPLGVLSEAMHTCHVATSAGSADALNPCNGLSSSNTSQQNSGGLITTSNHHAAVVTSHLNLLLPENDRCN
ncbi:MAG: hypothetical protein M1817_000673 [Caeruleum heppii]|nr:MAG: hypothetical protein M1817_000673 [Caeruleum heppii]